MPRRKRLIMSKIQNYEILKDKINSAIKDSQLDIGAVYFILKNIMIVVEQLYYSQINRELQEEIEHFEEVNLINEDEGEE